MLTPSVAMGLIIAAGALLSAVAVRMLRRRTPHPPAPRPKLEHGHYCAECDVGWVHEGRTCLNPWPWRCPRCAGAVDAAATVSEERRHIGLSTRREHPGTGARKAM